LNAEIYFSVATNLQADATNINYCSSALLRKDARSVILRTSSLEKGTSKDEMLRIEEGFILGHKT